MESKYCTGIEDVREKSDNFVGGQGKLQMSSNFCSSVKTRQKDRNRNGHANGDRADCNYIKT